VILDKNLCGKKLFKTAESVLKGGSDLVQYRDKNSKDDQFMSNARKIRALCKKFCVPFIVDDRLQIAIKLNADGVHLGENDLPVKLARKFLKNKIIGATCNNIQSAKSLIREGADYLGVGAAFETSTKPGRKVINHQVLKKISALPLPVFAIGGINQKNIKVLLKKGIRRFAVGSAICNSSNPKVVMKNILNLNADQRISNADNRR
jgi:thiamine-phosphate pyrophosphorylase